MVKTTMSEERLRKFVQKIVREELEQAAIKKENRSQKSIPQREDASILSIANSSPWAVFGPPRPDPEKNFQRLERPRALPGWSEPYQDDDDFQPGPYRPKRAKK